MAQRRSIVSMAMAFLATVLLALAVSPASGSGSGAESRSAVPTTVGAVQRVAKPTAVASALCQNSITYRCPLTCEAAKAPVAPSARPQTNPRDKSVTVSEELHDVAWDTVATVASGPGSGRGLRHGTRDPDKAPFWAVFATTARMHA